MVDAELQAVAVKISNKVKYFDSEHLPIKRPPQTASLTDQLPSLVILDNSTCPRCDQMVGTSAMVVHFCDSHTCCPAKEKLPASWVNVGQCGSM